MTLSFALNNAVTGLAANSTQAELIANNVANALTEGYGRREASLSSISLGGAGAGVRVDGVTRASSPVATDARRVAEAAEGASAVRADVLSRLSEVVGEPGEPDALATLADKMDTAFAAAADTPESAVTLRTAARAAGDYATAVNRIALEAISLRGEMDASIATQVDTINSSLTKIQSLNTEIKAREISGADTSALLDQRERLIKSVSSMLPVRTQQREFGSIAVYTQSGGQLLDGKVFPLEFEPSAAAPSSETIENGGLSGLASNGVPVRAGEAGLFGGGSLAAAFDARDTVIPDILDGLDALAASLLQRTEGLPADTSSAPGAAGLFTDGGAAFDGTNQLGLSERLALNVAVDEDRGGEATRLRDGLGATAPGTEGDNRILRGLQDALTTPSAVSAAIFSGARGIAGFSTELSAGLLASSSAATEDAANQTGRADTLRAAELSEIGVDTDQELSRLLQVEQAFAANARVIEVVDTLMQRLLQI